MSITEAQVDNIEGMSNAAKVRTKQAVREADKAVQDFKDGLSGNPPQNVGGVAGARLKSIVERIERLTEEKEALQEDIKEVFAEAKGTGFDVKAVRKIIRLRKMDAEKRREEDEILELYKAAIGLA